MQTMITPNKLSRLLSEALANCSDFITSKKLIEKMNNISMSRRKVSRLDIHSLQNLERNIIDLCPNFNWQYCFIGAEICFYKLNKKNKLLSHKEIAVLALARDYNYFLVFGAILFMCFKNHHSLSESKLLNLYTKKLNAYFNKKFVFDNSMASKLINNTELSNFVILDFGSLPKYSLYDFIEPELDIRNIFKDEHNLKVFCDIKSKIKEIKEIKEKNIF